MQCIIAVDDIIGSGESAVREVTKLAGEANGNPKIKNVPWFYIAVCGFDDSTRLLEETISQLNFRMEVIVCDSLMRPTRLSRTNQPSS